MLSLGLLSLRALSFGKPYYRYYTLSSRTKDFLKGDTYDVEGIRKNILENAADLHVPLDEKDLDVTIKLKIVRVRATWSETVDFWGYYQKQLDFAMDEEY